MVQWGAVERKPRRYDWSGYRQPFNLIKALGLKIQVNHKTRKTNNQAPWGSRFRSYGLRI